MDNTNNTANDSTATRTCTRCTEDKSVSLFNRKGAGYQVWCKACTKLGAQTRKALRGEALKTFTFGVELETVHATREACIKAVQSVVGGEISNVGGSYDKWVCTAADGRPWIAMRDSSLSTYNHAEVVSPICTYADLETVQKVARALYAIGARADSSCGIHVHVGADKLGPQGVARLVRLVHSVEPVVTHALGILSHRHHFCRPMTAAVLNRVGRATIKTSDDLALAWYGNANNEYRRSTHYDDSRYHGLNVHSVFYRGTVEFRWFNGTLHAGKVKSYIQLALALAAKAHSQKTMRSAPADVSVEGMRACLDWLGLTGKEFETARGHLTSAWPVPTTDTTTP